MFCTVETKRKPLNFNEFRGFHLFAVILRGATGNRTRDTRIFSPLLYQLSYGTVFGLGVQKFLQKSGEIAEMLTLAAARQGEVSVRSTGLR